MQQNRYPTLALLCCRVLLKVSLLQRTRLPEDTANVWSVVILFSTFFVWSGSRDWVFRQPKNDIACQAPLDENESFRCFICVQRAIFNAQSLRSIVNLADEMACLEQGECSLYLRFFPARGHQGFPAGPILFRFFQFCFINVQDLELTAADPAHRKR